MLQDLFFALGLPLLFARLMLLYNFRAVDAYLNNPENFPFADRTTTQQLVSVFLYLVQLPWVLFSLATDQWWVSLTYLLLARLLFPLIYNSYPLRYLRALLLTLVMLGMILNHFHLHYTPPFLQF